MSHSLAGRNVDEVLVEFWGPITGRNHFPALGAAAPQAQGQLTGADPATVVVLESCTTLVMVGTNNSNAIGSTPVRGGKLVLSQDPADWAAVGAPMTVAAGLLTLVLPVGTTIAPVGLRLRIDAVPAGPDPLVGGVDLATQWN